jgi:hypothetical protein
VLGRRIVSGLATAAAVVTLGMVSAPMASAATTVSVRTTDSGAIGATGIFWGNNPGAIDSSMRTRERLGACDKQKGDNKIAYAEVQWKLNGQWQFYSLYDTDGGGNGCHEAWLPNIKEGTTVHIKACLQTSVNHKQEYCGTGTAVA